jgi:beta-galactosidase
LQVERQPGPLADALGGRVEQFYALESPIPVSGSVAAGSAVEWAEQLSTHSDAEKVLLRYGAANGWLDGQPAMISRLLGKGRITYLGAVLDAAAMHSTTAWMIRDAGVEPEFGPVPVGVEMCRRVGPARVVYIFINHGAARAEFSLPRAMRDLLASGRELDQVTLEPQGVAVLEDGSDLPETQHGEKQ